MNKMLSGILAAGIVAGLTTGANAQDAGGAMKVAKPFSVKLGGLFFGDGDTKDAIGSSTLSIGLGYDFLKTKAENPVVVQGYVDYFAPKSKTRSIGDVRSEGKLDYSIGLGVAARYQLVRATETSSFFPYAGVGLGIYRTKVSVSGFDGESNFSESNTSTGLGGKLFLGAELKQGFFGELEYNYLPKVEDAKFSGFGARIGYRF
jgi:opacity protein-like surface antigen